MARTLEPYREAQLTPLMKWSITIGSILFAIFCLIAMPIITLAQTDELVVGGRQLTIFKGDYDG